MDAERPQRALRDAGDTIRTGPIGTQPERPFEEVVDALLRASHLAGANDIPALVAQHAVTLGGHDAVLHLVDLQQRNLVPFLPTGPSWSDAHRTLKVDSTVAGRAYQHVQIQTQDLAAHGGSGTKVWLPLLDGTERLGVLGVTVHDGSALERNDGLLAVQLQRFASLVAELIVTKTLYGDTVVRLRRTAPMGLAAEIQWQLLPPLTFANETVTVAAGLEPAYEVAGDSVDYAVDGDVARFAVFDGMGHGLASAQLVSLVVAAYRNARRTGLGLAETAAHMDAAVTEIFRGEAFSTGVVGQLDTATGILTWMSAGHPEPLLIRDGRLVRILNVQPSLPFGLGRELAGSQASVDVGSEHLQPGDTMLFYTDGVTEARSPDGEFFGQARLVDLVVRNLAANLPAPETLRRLVRSLLEHQAGDLSDDATLLLVQWHGHPADLRHLGPDQRRARGAGQHRPTQAATNRAHERTGPG
jgi:serine phosphatase RsbU (regulator of sigma subunit)